RQSAGSGEVALQHVHGGIEPLSIAGEAEAQPAFALRPERSAGCEPDLGVEIELLRERERVRNPVDAEEGIERRPRLVDGHAWNVLEAGHHRIPADAARSGE